MRGALLLPVVLAACFQPTIPAGARCSERGDCPGGEPCIAGVCGGTEPIMDAGPDVPPGTTVIVVGADRSQLRDTEVTGYDPDITSGEVDHFSVDELEVGLLAFSLPELPPGLTLQKATLELRTTDDADEGGGTVLVYRVREAWDELAATWIQRMPGTPWAKPGAASPSRDDDPIATLRPDREYATFTLALPVDLIRQWVADPEANHGLAFVRGTSQQHVHLGSRESPAWSKLTLELR
jgi:hypothetical protein